MTPIANFILMAKFNKLANEKIITSCNKLTELEYKKDRGAFFFSIHGTLNHLLVVDRAFISRLEVDEILSYTNPKTVCGEYLRRYWHPVALTSEISQIPKEIRILELIV